MLLRRLNLFFACCLAGAVLSSCGLLLKKRTVANSGIEREEFGIPVLLYQSAHPRHSKMILLLSGDGGWLGFNDTLAMAFANNGYNVIGVNSRTYFWHQKNPDQTSADFAQMIRKYSDLWHVHRIVLNGYSFGADVVPFIYNRLPPDLKIKVNRLQLLSPYLSTDFKVRLSDLLSDDGDDDRAFKVRDEVEKIAIPVICYYGNTENPKSLADLRMKNFFMITLPGGHHYKDSYLQIVSSLRRHAVLP